MHLPAITAGETTMPVCLIGLGSNQGDRRAILEAAVARLAAHREVEIIARSAWHETTPVGGPPGQPKFLNGALTLRTTLAPHDLLAHMQQVEDALGRDAGHDGDLAPSTWICCSTTS